MTHFQKTIALPLPELREAEAKQAGLAVLILGMFEFTHGTFTPSDVHRSLTNAGYRYRDTSARTSVDNQRNELNSTHCLTNL